MVEVRSPGSESLPRQGDPSPRTLGSGLKDPASPRKAGKARRSPPFFGEARSMQPLQSPDFLDCRSGVSPGQKTLGAAVHRLDSCFQQRKNVSFSLTQVQA